MADELQRVGRHIENCDRCRRLLARIERTSDTADFLWLELSGHNDDSIGIMTPAPPTPRQARATIIHLKYVVAFVNRARPLLAIGAGIALLVAFLVVVVVRYRPRTLHEQAAQTDGTSNRLPVPEASSTAEPATPSGTSLPATGVIVASVVDNGRKVSIDDHRNLNGFEGLPGDWQKSIIWAMEHHRLNLPAAALALIGQPGSLRGRPESGTRFELTSPVGDVIESIRPVLSWQPLDGAMSYEVNLFDSAYRAIASSGPLNRTEWTIPFELERGRVYSWQVTGRVRDSEVISPSFPAPEARFMIVDASAANDLRRANAVRPRSQLLMALLYARVGLFQKAEGELRLLRTHNPDSKLVKDLLQSLRAAGARQLVVQPSGAALH